MLTLEQRVARLEKSCRRWRLLAMFAAMVSAILVGMGDSLAPQTPSTPPTQQ